MSLKKIIFVCTSNKDRSPALENYFKETHPNYEYRSAGINKYFCEKKRTHLIDENDIKWADLFVFAEYVHLTVVKDRYKAETPIANGYDSKSGSINFTELNAEKKYIVLNCGEYTQGCVGEDYLTRAEIILKEVLK